jgi:UDP-glucose 4-epimerase
MRIMLLGGLGFIGSHTSARLKHRGHTVGIMDSYNQYDYFPDNEYFDVLNQRRRIASADSIFRGRVEDVARLNEVLVEFRPDVVLHLATYPNARMVERDPIDASNNMVTGTINVLRSCADHNVRRVVFASSSMVYGDFYPEIPDERFLPTPATLYGRFKLRGERICQRLGRQFGLETVILRPSALYGPRDMIVRVISLMAKSCILRGRIVVQGKDSQLDFSYVEDVAEAFVLAALHPGAAGQVFNCTRGRGRTLLEAAEILRASLGHGVIETREADKFYPSRGALNSDKIKDELGWEPQIELEIGVPAYLGWLLRQSFLQAGPTQFSGRSRADQSGSDAELAV